MPTRPRRHNAVRSDVRTLKSRTDSHRYGSDWRKIRLDVLARNPVCYCGLFRWFCESSMSVRVYQDIDCDGTIAESTMVDHIRPLSRGGDHSLGNLQALCQKCHNRKTRLFG